MAFNIPLNIERQLYVFIKYGHVMFVKQNYINYLLTTFLIYIYCKGVDNKQYVDLRYSKKSIIKT